MGACVHFPRKQGPRPGQDFKQIPPTKSGRVPLDDEQARLTIPQPVQSTSHNSELLMGMDNGQLPWKALGRWP